MIITFSYVGEIQHLGWFVEHFRRGYKNVVSVHKPMLEAGPLLLKKKRQEVECDREIRRDETEIETAK